MPKNEDIRSKWIAAISHHDLKFKILKSFSVCELHFRSEDYHIPFTSISNTVQLKKDAVPSIFNKNGNN